MFAPYVFAVLCWVSASHAAPLACDNLLQPLDGLDRRHLEGSWSMVAGSMSDATHLERFRSRDSVGITFANSSEASELSFTRIHRLNDSCQGLQSNTTLEVSGFTLHLYNVTVNLLQTSCPDCVVMHFKKKPMEVVRLYMFSRRREVEQKEMEEFKAQAECLKVLPPVVMDPTKELCTEQIFSDASARTEAMTEGQRA